MEHFYLQFATNISKYFAKLRDQTDADSDGVIEFKEWINEHFENFLAEQWTILTRNDGTTYQEYANRYYFICRSDDRKIEKARALAHLSKHIKNFDVRTHLTKIKCAMFDTTELENSKLNYRLFLMSSLTQELDSLLGDVCPSHEYIY